VASVPSGTISNPFLIRHKILKIVFKFVAIFPICFGRVGIFETLSVTEKIAGLVLEKADSGTIEKESISQGMITMKQDGYIKALEGITTLEEVIRVAKT